MPKCASCGADLTGRFCALCGTPAPASAAPPTPPPPPPPASSASAPDLPANLVCALTYAMGPLSAVLFLVLEPYNKNPLVRFHAFQSLFVSLAWFVLWLVLVTVTAILSVIPLVGIGIGTAILGAFSLASFALWIVLMVKAYQNEKWKVPVLGDFAEKQSYTN